METLKFFKYTFFILYFSVLVYLCFKDVKIYIDNEDSSSISFRMFNASPRDKYPVITLCFNGKTRAYEVIYKKDELRKNGFSVKEYWETITGRKNLTIDEIEKLPDFSAVTINLKELTRFYKSMDRNGKYFNKFNSKASEESPSENDSSVSHQTNSSLPFYLSYQNPNLVCYSQRANFNNTVLKFEDQISLDIKTFLRFDSQSTKHGRLHIFIHYQGQTVRSFGKEVFDLPMIENDMKKRILIRLSGMTVVRRRLDGKVQCNPVSELDDVRFQDILMERTKCVPPYWKGFVNFSTILKPCFSVDQLKRTFWDSSYQNTRRLINNLDPPCEEFSVTSSVDVRDNRRLLLSFQYQSDKYLEIRNNRDFEFISLFASIGGLIGIFLGFSMFQMSELLLNRVYEVLNTKNQNVRIYE